MGNEPKQRGHNFLLTTFAQKWHIPSTHFGEDLDAEAGVGGWRWGAEKCHPSSAASSQRAAPLLGRS